jgi:para-nitrobenzyl esterase
VPKGQYPAPVRVLLPEVDIPGEECLNLNVWTPAAGLDDPEPRRPVMVWIHGGSFLNGSGSLPEYDGTAFARDGVVCVTINYRLGAEGFLQLPDAEPNRGLLDMVAALRWVHEEIAHFGGDPDAVTVAGESAGAMAIAALMAMPAARGLFARAILHSAAAPLALPLAQATQIAEQLGAAAGRPVARAQSPVSDARLAGVAPRVLPFAPVIDGGLLPADPLAAAGAGVAADIPVLLGTTRDEARLFLVPTRALDSIDDELLASAGELYGLSAAATATYRNTRATSSPGDVLAAIVTDQRFLRPALQLAEVREEVGAPTWLARFDAVALDDNDGLGSCHAVEVPFAFANVDLPALRPRIGAAPSAAAAATLHGAWVAFASGGSPGWPEYNLTTRPAARLTDVVTVVEDPAGDERRAWPNAR